MAIFLQSPCISSAITSKNSRYPFSNPNSTRGPQTLTISTNLKPAPPHSIGINTFPDSQTLKSRLKNGETLYGVFLLSFSPTIAEIAGFAGYDFAVIDMEHGYGGISDALGCLRALAATNTAAILRLPESSAMWAKKALDIGPQGIMFPNIDSPTSAQKVVSYCCFPPKGVRGSNYTNVRASSYDINKGYLSNCEEELLIMCQVESRRAVKKIDEISAVDGVDCIQMGPSDLSASLGYLPDPGNKKVVDVLRGAEKAVVEGGRAYLSGFMQAHEGPEELRRRGYNMAVSYSDVGLFRREVVKDVMKFKTKLLEHRFGDENGKEDGVFE